MTTSNASSKGEERNAWNFVKLIFNYFDLQRELPEYHREHRCEMGFVWKMCLTRMFLLFNGLVERADHMIGKRALSQ